jgi:hypothetical protein
LVVSKRLVKRCAAKVSVHGISPDASHRVTNNVFFNRQTVTHTSHVIPKIIIALLSGWKVIWIAGSNWPAVASIVFIASSFEDLLSPLTDLITHWGATSIRS